MIDNYILNGSLKSQISFRTVLIGFIASLSIMFGKDAVAQPAVYIAETFTTNIPAAAQPNFRTPITDWTQSKITGLSAAPNNWQWVSTGSFPTVGAGSPAGTGFARYVNRNVVSGGTAGINYAAAGDAAFLASRSLDWSGHTTYNAGTDLISLAVWRDNTAAFLGTLDYIEMYVNTTPSLAGAALALTTTGANRIHRSSIQTPVGAVANAWNTYQFVIPNDPRFWNATTGGTSSAYIIIAGYSAAGNNIFIDNVNMPQWQTPMQVTGLSVVAPLNADVGKGTFDNLMLQVQVTTKGSINPRRIDGIAFSTNGSTAFTTDVVQPNGPKCWYTGGLPTFATTAGAISVPKVNPTLPSYTNATLYFGNVSATTGCPLGGAPANVIFHPGNENFIWLAYDITVGAVPGQNVAGALEHLFTGWTSPNAVGCTGDTMITAANIQTPVSVAAFTPAPSLSAVRQIDQAYTIPTYTAGTSWQGGSYTNNDYVSGVEIFGDNGSSIENYEHDANCVSCVAIGGLYCNRFACHPPDYTQFPPQNAGLYKIRGTLQVTQGKGMRKGTAPYVLKAQCGTWFSANVIGVFIDWNKDGDFDDVFNGVGGNIYENYGSQSQVQSNMSLPIVWGANTTWNNIHVPLPTDVVIDQNNALQPPNNSTGPIIIGSVRLRVREIFAAPTSPAGVIGVHPTQSGFTWGEVEDYTIQVLDDCPNPATNICKWVGASNDWNDPNNWCPTLPTKHDIAYINTGPQFMPVILDGTNAVCRTLRIMQGAKLGVNAPLPGSSLKVYDDVEIGYGATAGTGSSIAVTSDFAATLTIPGKSSVPPAGFALIPQTPFRTNAQGKTQIGYTATELANTYGWKAGDIVDQISIEVNSITGGAAASSYPNFRIQAYLKSTVQTYTFPPPANTKIALAAGDADVIATWPRTIFSAAPLTLNMPMGTAGTQAGGNYYTFNLIPNTLVWDGVSNLVLSFEYNTAIGSPPAKNYVLYDENSGVFNVLSVNYTTAGAVITGWNIDGAGHYGGVPGATNAGITATVSTLRPRLDFKWHRPYDQFDITVGGDWINNNRFQRAFPYSTTPVYGIPGDSGFIASNSRVIFDPTGRVGAGGVSSPGLGVAYPPYTTSAPGVNVPGDINQDITSESSGVGNATVFGYLEINNSPYAKIRTYLC